MIVEKANKCLFTLITKNEEWKGFEATLLLYLFDHLISPILSYGFEIWGNCRWEDIEKIHLFICKYALGVKKSTPIVLQPSKCLKFMTFREGYLLNTGT